MNIESKFLRVITIDDHEIILCGLNNSIAKETDLELVGSYRNSSDMLESLNEMKVDVAIVDYTLHPDDLEGEDLLNLLQARYPAMKIVVFSASYDSATVRKALRAGAKGFIGKNHSLDELITAVRKTACGDIYIAPDMVLQLVQNRKAPASLPKRSSKKTPIRLDENKISILTPREVDVIRYYLMGMTASEIGEKFCRSVKTISGQKRSAFQKLGIKNDYELYNFFRADSTMKEQVNDFV